MDTVYTILLITILALGFLAMSMVARLRVAWAGC